MEQISIDLILANPNNPRRIKAKELEKLKKSIAGFSKMLQVRPLVLDESLTIIGGNQRFLACKELGFEAVPCEVVAWSEAEKKEFLIKDNLSSGEWDWDLLKADFEVETLADWGLELETIELPAYDFEDYGQVESESNSKNELKTQENFFPVSFVLGRGDYNKWLKFKKETNLKTDLSAFLKLLETV